MYGIGIYSIETAVALIGTMVFLDDTNLLIIIIYILLSPFC